jgi:hypothetical protein
MSRTCDPARRWGSERQLWQEVAGLGAANQAPPGRQSQRSIIHKSVDALRGDTKACCTRHPACRLVRCGASLTKTRRSASCQRWGASWCKGLVARPAELCGGQQRCAGCRTWCSGDHKVLWSLLYRATATRTSKRTMRQAWAARPLGVLRTRQRTNLMGGRPGQAGKGGAQASLRLRPLGGLRQA